ncbi:MAG: S41 family peptidase [Deltaproteobacteria bacterium]|nr:S41 family peptidase [Deltaproteobacteria bacterium]
MAAERLAQAAQGKEVYRQLDVFTRVLSYIENNYVEEVNEKKLIQGAIKGMVGTLDPHTLFMPQEIFKDMKVDTSGEFGGLGIELTSRMQVKNGVRSEVLMVVAPIDDTPAARAGVKAGDVIFKIDGESTAEMDLVTAVSRMRGPAGSKVVLTILREGFTEARDLILIRDHIRIVSVEGRLHEGGYGYVKIKSFQEQTDRYLKRVLDELRRQHKGELKGLVLDLRNNPGGLLDQAVKVSDRFLAGGLVIVTTKGRGGRHVEEEKSHERDTEAPYPMIVLVNGGSASASEIVAGALQDHGRAVIMGRATFGKGSVQTLIELEDGSGLKLTIARYYTPKGRSIQEKGIQPDVAVKTAEDGGPREVDLRNHFRSEDGKPASKPSPEEASVVVPESKPGEDELLKTALDYLRTWQIFKATAPSSAGSPPARVP